MFVVVVVNQCRFAVFRGTKFLDTSHFSDRYISSRAGMLRTYVCSVRLSRTLLGIVLSCSVICTAQCNQVRNCPCEDVSLCKVVTAKSQKEVYGFAIKTEAEHYLKYDWDKLTSIAMWDWTDELMCFAHSKGVRLDLVVSKFPKEQLTNLTFREQWVADTVSQVRTQFLDGINFDPEYPILLSEPERAAMIQLVQETRAALLAVRPGSKISFDVAWAPSCVDDRCYDYVGISEVVDFLFVMSYDIQGQVWGPDCIAMPNTPFQQMVAGVKGYLALGVPPSKVVLGLPWYGYDYPCLNITEGGICHIPRATYVGAPCSDLVGNQKQFDEMLVLMENSTDGRKWNYHGSSPQFDYKNGKGEVRQVHYDDEESLKHKYDWAVQSDLRGVGFWHINCLQDMDTPKKKELRRRMWDLIPSKGEWTVTGKSAAHHGAV